MIKLCFLFIEKNLKILKQIFTISSMKNKENIERINKLLYERDKIQYQINEIDNKLFKIESYYFEFTSSFPITKTIEFYLKNKVEKKKTNLFEEEKIYSTDYPTIKTTNHFY